jgi:hypothetical protein
MDADERKRYLQDFHKKNYSRVSLMIPNSEKTVVEKISKETNKNGYIIGLVKDDILKGTPIHGAIDAETLSSLIYQGKGTYQILFRSCQISDSSFFTQDFEITDGSRNETIENLLAKVRKGLFQAVAPDEKIYDTVSYHRIAIVFSRSGEYFIVIEKNFLWNKAA